MMKDGKAFGKKKKRSPCQNAERIAGKKLLSTPGTQGTMLG
jgi:hypothetical protein